MAELAQLQTELRLREHTAQLQDWCKAQESFQTSGDSSVNPAHALSRADHKQQGSEPARIQPGQGDRELDLDHQKDDIVGAKDRGMQNGGSENDPHETVVDDVSPASPERQSIRDPGHRTMPPSSWLEGLLKSPGALISPISTSSLFMPVPGGLEAGKCGGDDATENESKTEARHAGVQATCAEEEDEMRGGLDEILYSCAPPSPRHIRGPSPPPSMSTALAVVSKSGEEESPCAKEEERDGSAGADEDEHEVWC